MDENSPIYIVLHEGVDAWNAFQNIAVNNKKRIQISFLCENRTDFSGYRFINCDFSSVSFNGINFDNCFFDNCYFLGCEIENSSFSYTTIKNCEIVNSIYKNTIFKNANIKNLKIERVEFTNNKFISSIANCISSDSVKISHIEITGSKIQNMYSGGDARNCIDNINIRCSEFYKIKSQETKFSDICIDSSKFYRSEFVHSSLKNTQINNVEFLSSIIKYPIILSFINTKSCSFMEGSIIETDIEYIDITDVKLMNTSFIACNFPTQDYHVGLLGQYEKAANLLGQPVEDIKGITPSLREKIRNSQLVHGLVTEKNKFYHKILLRIWGITSEYGRSLYRLTLSSLLVILIFSIIHFLYSYENSNFLCSMKCISLSFIGFDNQSISNLFIIVRLIGIVLWGIWIGMAANKFIFYK